jgi:hypothetical protein
VRRKISEGQQCEKYDSNRAVKSNWRQRSDACSFEFRPE